MADYGQTSTSPGSFSLDMGEPDLNQPPPYSQNLAPKSIYVTEQDEFQFHQGNTSSTVKVHMIYRTDINILGQINKYPPYISIRILKISVNSDYVFYL